MVFESDDDNQVREQLVGVSSDEEDDGGADESTMAFFEQEATLTDGDCEQQKPSAIESRSEVQEVPTSLAQQQQQQQHTAGGGRLVGSSAIRSACTPQQSCKCPTGIRSSATAARIVVSEDWTQQRTVNDRGAYAECTPVIVQELPPAAALVRGINNEAVDAKEATSSCTSIVSPSEKNVEAEACASRSVVARNKKCAGSVSDDEPLLEHSYCKSPICNISKNSKATEMSPSSGRSDTLSQSAAMEGCSPLTCLYEEHDGDDTVVSMISLRRSEQLLLSVTPGAVSIYPHGFMSSSSTIMVNNDEELQRIGDASYRSRQPHVPEATPVHEATLAHAVRDQTGLFTDVCDENPSSVPRCLRYRKMVFTSGPFIVILVGAIVAVTVTLGVYNNNNTSSTSDSGLITTLTPSLPPSQPPSVSSVPSLSPSDSFETYLVKLIQSRSPETSLSSNSVASAVNWTVNDPYTLALENDDDRVVQRFALACVWFAFGLKSSSSRREYREWMQPTDECSWRGQSLRRTPSCNLDDDVYALELGHDATGSIPVEISLLSHLAVLTLTGTKLTGSIPSQLSLVTSLTKLKLGSLNSGTIPSQLWTALTDLEDFSINVSPEMLPSTFPSNLSSLSKLTSLVLSGAKFTGSIPTALGTLTLLTALRLGGNPGLTGSIPTQFGMLSRLSHMDLAESRLPGPIPTEFGLLNLLTSLTLGGNSFGSTLPTELGLVTRLIRLDISNAAVNGSIPSEIGQLQKLRALHLGWNQLLQGSIPSLIYGMSKLTSLSFGGGGLDSVMSASLIMTEIGFLADLISLDLAGCNLTGSIPTEIGELNDLLELRLGRNRLSGTIPSELALLRKLTYLGLDQGNFSGSLTGSIPDAFCSIAAEAIVDCEEIQCSCCVCCCDC